MGTCLNYVTDHETPILPRALRIVAWLFIVTGICSIIDTVAELFLGRLTINLGVVYIVIGQGLLRLNPRSLAWAMFFTWLGLIALPVMAVASLFCPCRFSVFGVYVGQMPQGLCSACCAASFGILCWQYGVLTSHRNGSRLSQV